MVRTLTLSPAGLENGHAYRVNVIDAVKQFQRAQGIQHHLGILYCGYLPPFPCL